MYLVVTIDVEEDNWGEYNLNRYSRKNILKIPQLQKLFDKFRVKPTYLLSYPVATDETAVSIFNEIVHTNRCEIGTHPHSWNTPPFDGRNNINNSVLCNLPADLQFNKIRSLHEVIVNNFEIVPVTFRSGRWGFDNTVASNIYTLGYKVDTSITPYLNWTYIPGPNFQNCSPEPYRFNVDNIYEPISHGHILEIPATIGFLQQNIKYCLHINRVANQKMFRIMKAEKFLDKMGILNKILLSPEVTESESMIKLTENLKENGQKVINMFFHSPSLLSGCSPFTKTAGDVRKIFQRIEAYLEFCRGSGFEPVTVKSLVNVIR